MRGWAALYVVFYHFAVGYNIYLPASILWFEMAGYSGVEFFFVLTGYLLATLYSSTTAKYFIRRVFRTFPLYYAMFVPYVLLGLTAATPLYFIYAQDYFPSAMIFSNPLWTLCIEELFYFVVFPLILIISHHVIRIKVHWLVFVGIIISIAWCALPLPIYALVEQIPTFFICYAVGIMISRVNLGKRLETNKFIWIIPTALFFGCAFALTRIVPPVCFEAILWSVVYGMVILFMKDARFFTNKISHFLGKISYGVYIIQGPVMWMARGWYYPYGIFISVGATIVLATLSYYLFEKRLVDFGHRITSNMR